MSRPISRGDRTIKWGGATRVVKQKPILLSDLRGRLVEFDRDPERNDVAVAEVIEVNHHGDLELESGRRSRLFEGDLIGVAFGYRYATHQFEGIIPGLREEYDLLSVGGVCGEVVGKPVQMDIPTKISPIGYLGNGQGHPVNLRAYRACPSNLALDGCIPTILVVGTSMDSGKTTAAAGIVRGLTLAGQKVCAGKLTGTAASRDIYLMSDAGAVRVMDFTWVGHASTAMCEEAELVEAYHLVRGSLAAQCPDYIVLEIADGLAQRETSMLLTWLSKSGFPIKVVCAVGDALALHASVEYLERLRLNLVGISGLVTRTPLSTREAAAATVYPVWSHEQLSDPAIKNIFAPLLQEHVG